jgi:tetratricopeptide (TPR) repeat protein
LTARTLAYAFISVALGGLLLASGCKSASERACGQDTAVVDLALVAYLSQARALHHEADLFEDAGDLEAALRAMARIGQLPLADGTKLAPVEVREVKADALARTAELELKRGNLDAAQRHVEAGLQLAREDSYYRGHLYELLGRVEQARFRKASDPKSAEAQEAKKRALAALEESLRIQAKVVQSLDGAGNKPKGSP